MSDSFRPHGLQPTRLLRPWNFPGKSIGVGCLAFSRLYYKVNIFFGNNLLFHVLYLILFFYHSTEVSRYCRHFTYEENTSKMSSVQFSSVAQSCLTLCDPMNCSTQSAKTKPGADCGSDHELLIAKFRLKLKKAGKTTRPFRYDLNQILMIIQRK